MSIIEQIIKESCNGCACLGTDKERLDCFRFVFKTWIQRHKIELLKQYAKDDSNNLAYRINHCNEILEMLRNG